MNRIKGSCLCGKSKFESTAEPLMIAACHCSHCRKQSGSAFSMNIGVPANSVTLSGDSLKVYKDKGASGEDVLRHFCGNCGSPIFSDVKAADGLYFIKVGTLDDSSWVVPGIELWCDSKVAWGTLNDDVPKISQNPPLE